MEFKRTEGLVGSAPRKWMDSKLPKCPFCKESVLWELAVERGQFWFEIPQKWFKAYHFRCPKCLSLLSIPANAVISMPLMYDGSIYGMFNLARQVKAKREEEPWDGKVLVQNTGNSAEFKHLVGTEVLLQELQDLARQTKK